MWSASRCLKKQGNAKEIIAPSPGTARYLENQVWVTTSDGYRLPTSYFDAKPRFKHVVACPYIDDIHGRDRESGEDEAYDVALQHFLPRLEKYSGTQLLRAVATKDMDDFKLVLRDASSWDTVHEERKQARANGQFLEYDRNLDNPQGPYEEEEVGESTEDAFEMFVLSAGLWDTALDSADLSYGDF
ncbi:hypothetical protein H2200_011366 [Cladophialophora chaetospira]|uniref:Uncharacterized protein n=1 Tax=Cladophialophora chaetospira TaxID=386627 RepID=A0AA39CD26_9EURO|nr:hypothetical protein H2200_011366 [Cladophialophora chaetospira]